jgi:hypothetical protein
MMLLSMNSKQFDIPFVIDKELVIFFTEAIKYMVCSFALKPILKRTLPIMAGVIGDS